MTNDLDLDRDLRDTFHRHEQDLLGRAPTPPPNMFQRIRRRQTGTVLLAAVAAAAIAIAGISGLDAIRASEQTPASSRRPDPAGRADPGAVLQDPSRHRRALAPDGRTRGIAHAAVRTGDLRPGPVPGATRRRAPRRGG